MKKFQFSLSHMRDYKERILDEEQGLLHRLKSEEAEIQQKIERLEREFQETSRKMQQAQEKGTTAMEIRRLSSLLDSIRLQQKEQRAALKRASKKVDDQMKVVVAANQEVSKLDKLEDRQYEAYRQEAAKAEELRVEELVIQALNRQDAV